MCIACLRWKLNIIIIIRGPRCLKITYLYCILTQKIDKKKCLWLYVIYVDKRLNYYIYKINLINTRTSWIPWHKLKIILCYIYLHTYIHDRMVKFTIHVWVIRDQDVRILCYSIGYIWNKVKIIVTLENR